MTVPKVKLRERKDTIGLEGDIHKLLILSPANLL